MIDKERKGELFNILRQKSCLADREVLVGKERGRVKKENAAR